MFANKSFLQWNFNATSGLFSLLCYRFIVCKSKCISWRCHWGWKSVNMHAFFLIKIKNAWNVQRHILALTVISNFISLLLIDIDDKCILTHLIWLEERISIDKLNERISTFQRIYFCRKVSSENHYKSGNGATSEQCGTRNGFSSTKTLFRKASMLNDSQTYTCCVLCSR